MTVESFVLLMRLFPACVRRLPATGRHTLCGIGMVNTGLGWPGLELVPAPCHRYLVTSVVSVLTKAARCLTCIPISTAGGGLEVKFFYKPSKVSPMTISSGFSGTQNYAVVESVLVGFLWVKLKTCPWTGLAPANSKGYVRGALVAIFYCFIETNKTNQNLCVGICYPSLCYVLSVLFILLNEF